MPHLIIEVSNRALFKDHQELLLALNNNLLESQEFKADDIKSRLYIAEAALVGVTQENQEFIVATLKIMPGRSKEIQQRLIAGIIKTIQQCLPSNLCQHIEITVEILELNPSQYCKFMT